MTAGNTLGRNIFLNVHLMPMDQIFRSGLIRRSNRTPTRTRGERRAVVNYRSRAPVGVDVSCHILTE